MSPAPAARATNLCIGIEDGKIPDIYYPVIEKAFHEACSNGPLSGYPLVDIQATLFDGSFNELSSTETGYTIATAMAMRDAVERGQPVLLEPIMEVEIVTPEEFTGEIIADLNSRKGKIEMIENKGKTRIMRARVSLVTYVRLLNIAQVFKPGEGNVYHEIPPVWHGPGTSSDNWRDKQVLCVLIPLYKWFRRHVSKNNYKFR